MPERGGRYASRAGELNPSNSKRIFEERERERRREEFKVLLTEIKLCCEPQTIYQTMM